MTAKALPREPTWEIAYLFPAQGTWTEWDYMRLRPNRHVEFTHGVLEVLPMPTQSHQRILAYLFQVLLAWIKARRLGEVLFAPLRVRLAEHVYREPDIVFMRAEHASRCGEDFWEGADLVMEIVSVDDRSRERDLKQKRSEYAQAGIPEYWIVDPLDEKIIVLVLAGETYAVHGEFGRGAQTTSPSLPGFGVDVAVVLDAARQ